MHPDFLGSASLKKVLPVLVSHLSYDGLKISSGEQAMLAWPDLINPDHPDEDKTQLKKDMLEYCKLDTLAMVEILKTVEETISN